MPKGDDPKKPKANAEVKVTAKKKVEPPQKQYTWDDVSKNEEVKSRNKVARERYESETANYNKQLKAYGELEPKGKRDMQTFFQGGGRYLTGKELEDWNKEQSASGQEGRAGLKASKIYVSKGYGTDQPGKSTLSNERGSYQGFKGTFHEWLEKPKPSTAPVYEKEENIDVRKLPPTEKLPLLKPGKIDSGGGKLVTRSTPSEPTEKSDWQDPSGVRVKSRFVKPKNVKVGEYIGQNIKYAAQKATGKNPILRPGVEKKKEALIQGKSGREGKMAKAYFSEYEGKSKNDIKGALGDLKADKADFKSAIKEVRKGTAAPSTIDKSERIQGLRAAKKDVKAEMKQAKLASKYLGKLGEEYIGVRAGQKLSSTGKIKENTPDKYLGFPGSKQDVDNRDAKFNKFLAKSSTDNAANRNTIPNQEKALSFKEKVASDKAERQNAPSFRERRKEKKADMILQKSIKIPK